MFFDPLRKTIKVPVQYVGGTFVARGGQVLPELREGASADLVFQASALKDRSQVTSLTAEQVMEILPKGETVYLGMRPAMMSARAHEGLEKPQPLSAASGLLLLPIILNEPLRLRVRKNKKAELEACECFIPMLKRNAISINHAYTLASTELETRRRSHTGNVFDLAFYRSEEFLFPLSDLRHRLEHAVFKDTQQE